MHTLNQFFNTKTILGIHNHAKHSSDSKKRMDVVVYSISHKSNCAHPLIAIV
jgi:hypothetical protein